MVIDFKTDQVTSLELEERMEQYRIQMDCLFAYGAACHQKVSGTYGTRLRASGRDPHRDAQLVEPAN